MNCHRTLFPRNPMNRASLRVARVAFGLFLAVGLSIGCSKKDEPQPTGPGPDSGRGQPKPGNPFEGIGKPPENETPEVAAYVKQKGWKLFTDMRLSDGKKMVYMSVENKDKPFEKLALSADDYKMIAKSKSLQVLDLRN